jgi:hypothetical protein
LDGRTTSKFWNVVVLVLSSRIEDQVADLLGTCRVIVWIFLRFARRSSSRIEFFLRRLLLQ